MPKLMNRTRKTGIIGTCLKCNRERIIYAKGMCQSCRHYVNIKKNPKRYAQALARSRKWVMKTGYFKDYYQKNRQKFLDYYKNHAEKGKAFSRDYYKKNKAACCAKQSLRAYTRRQEMKLAKQIAKQFLEWHNKVQKCKEQK